VGLVYLKRLLDALFLAHRNLAVSYSVKDKATVDAHGVYTYKGMAKYVVVPQMII
jgi:hypothetical protein